MELNVFLRCEAQNVLKMFLNPVTSWWGGNCCDSMRMAGLLIPLSTTTQSWKNGKITSLIGFIRVCLTHWLCRCWSYFARTIRAWLHGEFQPGLKFRSAHRAEILLRLHGQFQPGRKTLISVRKFTEVRKHNRYACSRFFFSPGWKNDSDYMDFSARLAGLKILARF